jgi:hypothetical protein
MNNKKKPLIELRMAFLQVQGDTKPKLAVFLEPKAVWKFGECRTSSSC